MWNNFTNADLSQIQMVLLAFLPVLLLSFRALFKIVTFRASEIDVFSPIYIAAGSVFIGTTLRTFFLLFDPDSPDKMMRVLGPYYPDEVLMKGLLAINLGIFAWLLGFALPIKRFTKSAISRNYNNSLKILIPIAVLCLFANFYYMYAIDFFQNFSRLGLSAKRFFSLDGGEGRETSFQFLRTGSDIAFACLAIYAAVFQRSAKLFYNKFWLWFFVALAAMIPLIASVRGELVYIAIVFLLIRHYSIKPVSMRFLIIVFLIAISSLTYLEILRQQARFGDRADEFKATRIVHTLVYTAHFVGVGKTSAIVEKFPRQFDYLLGSSYATIFIAPIPRVLWPEKPVVRIGRFVGVEVMERNTVTGVVPGIIGEAYMNFGWLGVGTILFFFGVFCKAVYVRFALSADNRSALALGFYALLWIFIMDMFTSDFTGATIRLLRIGGPYLLIAYFINSQSKKLATSRHQTP